MSLGRLDLPRRIRDYLQEHATGTVDQIAGYGLAKELRPTATVGEIMMELWRMAVQGVVKQERGVFSLVEQEG